MFASYSKRISETRKRLEKVNGQLAPIEALRTERDQAAAQLAQLEAEHERAQAELDQLLAARVDVAQDIALFDTLLKDQAAGLRFLQHLVRICESGRLGNAEPVAKTYATALRAAEYADTLRQRQAALDLKLKELDQ